MAESVVTEPQLAGTDNAVMVEERVVVPPAQALTISDAPASRRYMILFERLCGVLAAVFLVAGLGVWMFKPGQHRLALLILVCAMFLSIIHYYTLEDPGGGPAGK